MSQVLRGFEINSPTWFYLSLLLAVVVYFRFTRLSALRNFDLLALLALAPGWLFLQKAASGDGPAYAAAGYVWLFVGTGWWLVRMLVDPLLTRRPMLEPNLNASGMTFLGAALLAFLVAEVITKPASASGVEGVREAQNLLNGQRVRPKANDPGPSADAPGAASDEERQRRRGFGPGWPFLHIVGAVPARALAQGDVLESEVLQVAARTIAILAHLAIVTALVAVAYWHFGQLLTGVGVAVLYLLLPYTAYHVGRTDQALPGALMIWAVAAYRRPALAGAVLGLAAGAFYFPIFLAPLWVSFFWRRGAGRFLAGLFGVLTLLLVGGLTTGDLLALSRQVELLSDPRTWTDSPMPPGFWQDRRPLDVIPVFAAFVVLCASLVLGRQPKNLATLLSHSSAILLGTQFWYAPQGGTYVLWYLPIVLLVVFRPVLADRLAAPQPRGPARLRSTVPATTAAS